MFIFVLINTNDYKTNPFTPTETKVYLTNLFFSECSNRAILYEVNGGLLVELCTFNNCHSSSDGGCIYQSKGQCIINKCCSFRCYSSSSSGWGQFIYNSLADDKSSKNRVLDSSITLSYKGNTYREYDAGTQRGLISR